MSANRRRKVTHYGVFNAKAACGNWLGTKAKTTEDARRVDCSGCLRALDEKGFLAK